MSSRKRVILCSLLVAGLGVAAASQSMQAEGATTPEQVHATPGLSHSRKLLSPAAPPAVAVWAGPFMLEPRQDEAAAASQPGQRVVRVMCIGDSITRGAVPPKGIEHPYAWALQSRLTALLKSKGGAKCEATAAGVGFAGVYTPTPTKEQITLIPHTRQVLADAKAKGIKYDWVVILAGVNDLTRGQKKAEWIMPGLEQMWQAALGSGANVLAVPPLEPVNWGRASDVEKQRRLLVQMISDRAAAMTKQNLTSGRKLVVYNPSTDGGPLDFYSKPSSTWKNLLCDGLHLQPSTYDTLGNLMAEAIARQM